MNIPQCFFYNPFPIDENLVGILINKASKNIPVQILRGCIFSFPLGQ